MSAQNIRAGKAFVEVSIRDNLAAGLRRAQGRLKAFAQTVNALGTSLRKVSMGFAAFGAGILAPLLNAAKTFAELGKAMGNADATKLTDTFRGLKGVFTAISFLAGEALAKPLTRLMEILIRLGAHVAIFVKNNKGLVVAIAVVGIAAAATAVVLGTVGVALGLLAAATAVLSFVIGTLATPLGATIGLVAALTAVAVVSAGAAVLMAKNWELAALSIEHAWQSVLANISGATSSMLGQLEKVAKALGQTALAARIGVAKDAIGVGADVARKRQEAAGVATLGELVGMGANWRAKFSGLALNTSAFATGGFGVAGTTSAAGAGRVGPSSIQKVDDKITHETLKDILTAIQGLEVGGELKFQ